jgi:hypothetical protein
MTATPSPFPAATAALNAFKAACARQWPPEAFALVNQTLADLAQTGIQQTALQAGDTAPGFSLPGSLIWSGLMRPTGSYAIKLSQNGRRLAARHLASAQEKAVSSAPCLGARPR